MPEAEPDPETRSPAAPPAPGADELGSDLDAVLRAARVLSGVVAASVEETGDVVTLPQLRVMVLVATRPGLNASSLASAMGVHPSSATRLCDRLVEAGLLDRRDSTVDRRHLVLELTSAGTALVGSVMEYRRVAFDRILRQMTPESRAMLLTGLQAFSDAADEPDEPVLYLP